MLQVPDRVCVIIGRTRHRMVVAELEEATELGAKFIELRLDYLARALDINRLLPLKKCAWVATIRRREDGGRWSGTEEERRMLMRQAIVAGFDWIDLEMDIADKIPRFGKVKRIVSYHNMKETPDDIEGIFDQMLKLDADVIKIATMAQSIQDNIRILKLIRKSPKPIVAHCMGELGYPTRILSIKLGAPFTYAAFNKERGIAPGLPSYDEICKLYDLSQVDLDTKVFGVVGDPVSHSFSPLLHNRMYRELKANAIYVPLKVPRGSLPNALKEYNMVPMDGYSVTIPHKEAAAALATKADQLVSEVGAANTLVRQGNAMHAFNTDYPAALQSLERNMPVNEAGEKKRLEGAIVLILGAGGAARAIAHGLAKQKALVKITSRTMDKSTKLATEIDGKAVEWDTRHNGECDVLINCTPVGMHPNLDDCPVHHSFLKPGMLVFDTIYTPENTLLIKQAKARGANVVTGVEMFVRQAAEQMKLFLNLEPDLDEMRKIMRKALSPASYYAAATPDSD